MDTALVGNSAGAGLSSPLTNAMGGTLGKNEFLQLLITQLRHQDPLSPMENEAFLAQLAQFSSLEQMQTLNQTMQDSMTLTQSLNNSSAASLIGRNVRANGETVGLVADLPIEVGYFLPSGAAHVVMEIYDDAGRLVRTLQSDAGTVGPHRLMWDGKGDAGVSAPTGRYQLKVQAFDATGVEVESLPIVTGRVDGVTFQGGSALLIVNGEELPLSSVLEVFQTN